MFALMGTHDTLWVRIWRRCRFAVSIATSNVVGPVSQPHCRQRAMYVRPSLIRRPTRRVAGFELLDDLGVHDVGRLAPQPLHVLAPTLVQL